VSWGKDYKLWGNHGGRGVYLRRVQEGCSWIQGEWRRKGGFSGKPRRSECHLGKDDLRQKKGEEMVRGKRGALSERKDGGWNKTEEGRKVPLNEGGGERR